MRHRYVPAEPVVNERLLSSRSVDDVLFRNERPFICVATSPSRIHPSLRYFLHDSGLGFGFGHAIQSGSATLEQICCRATGGLRFGTIRCIETGELNIVALSTLGRQFIPTRPGRTPPRIPNTLRGLDPPSPDADSSIVATQP